MYLISNCSHVYRRIQHPEGSGDGSGIPFADIDMLRPRPEYAGGAALEDAPPEVKRVLSLEFGRNKEVIEAYEGDLVRQVQRHKGDFSSLEVAITTLTIQGGHSVMGSPQGGELRSRVGR